MPPFAASPHPTSRSAPRFMRVLITFAVMLCLGWAARAPYDPPGPDALLRLSWRLRLPNAEVCRERTQEELDALPVHMRSPMVCDSRSDIYFLLVRIDSATVDSSMVRPGGVHGDRPVFVLRELPLTNGRHRVFVRFSRDESSSELDDTNMPRDIVLDTVLDIRTGVIELITLEDGHFVVRNSTHLSRNED